MAADAAKLAAYVRGVMQRDGVSADLLEGTVPSAQESIEGAPGAVAARDVDVLRKVERGEPLTDEDQFRLEAIVVPKGLRPSFDVLEDTFEDLPATWADVNARRNLVEPMIKGIGRVNLTGHPLLRFAGTAFVVSEELVLTNRHVAEFFVNGGPSSGATLEFKPGMSSVLDFRQEVGSVTTIPLRVTAPVVILERWDAALLRVQTLPAGVEPLRLAGAPPAAIDGRLAVVIGYPAMDPSADIIQQIQIFRGVFDKKRLMPGRLMGLKSTTSFGRTVTALGHDCTTLGGNSGSAVIDVNSGTVVGLHFAGEQFVANYAVPCWELAGESAITSAGVPFAQL